MMSFARKPLAKIAKLLVPSDFLGGPQTSICLLERLEMKIIGPNHDLVSRRLPPQAKQWHSQLECKKPAPVSRTVRQTNFECREINAHFRPWLHRKQNETKLQTSWCLTILNLQRFSNPSCIAAFFFEQHRASEGIVW